MTNLVAQTPVGLFTRKSDTAYTHVNVWNSPRAAECFAGVDKRTYPASGVHARWIKDRGYGVTWHQSEASALRAAAGRYRWDSSSTLVGTFAVEAAK